MRATGDVLVVDDDPDLREIVQIILRSSGYAVRSAANGRDALAAVGARRPAVVLLDMLMPVMDGWQCARELRARYGHAIPIVIVTAAEHAGARTRGLDVDAVLSKPFEMDDLVGLVSHYVANPSAAGHSPG